jgi:hypothetical protein
MIHVILCDTDYKRYCALSRRKTISINRCVNWLTVKSLIAQRNIQVIVINLELIPFEENILMQELKHFKPAFSATLYTQVQEHQKLRTPQSVFS